MLPLSVVIGAVVYLVTGNLVYALLAVVLDAVPIGFVYMSQLKAHRNAETAAQDRLTRYSSLQDDR
jgi:hypothetical protein